MKKKYLSGDGVLSLCVSACIFECALGVKGARGKKGREEGVKEREGGRGGGYLAVCLPVRALRRARVRSGCAASDRNHRSFHVCPFWSARGGFLARGRQRPMEQRRQRKNGTAWEGPRFLRSSSSSTEARRRKPRTGELIDMDSHVYFSIDSCLISDPC